MCSSGLLGLLTIICSSVKSDEFRIGFLPTLSPMNRHSESKYHVGALVYALEKINNDPNRLKGHTLTYVYNDTRAHALTSIRGMTSQYKADVLAFIGPEDKCETEAQIAAAWNVPMITYVSRVIYMFIT